MPYHYTESGLQNVYLQNGYTIRKTKYGATVAIEDVPGLHKAIGIALAHRPYLTGAGLRFLRKEMGLSQRALGGCVGTSEQNVSLWERRGRMPKAADRLVRLLYVEKVKGSVQVQKLLDELCDLDQKATERIDFQSVNGRWKDAA